MSLYQTTHDASIKIQVKNDEFGEQKTVLYYTLVIIRSYHDHLILHV